MKPDSVWFTYKARIQAHQRLEWLDVHSQFLLVWYAILSAILAVITIRFPQALGSNTDILASILSIALLGISLAVANRDFRGRAMAMRTNYLALQELYNQLKVVNTVSEKDVLLYHDLLSDVENHKDIDDKLFRVSARAELENRIPTRLELFQAYLWITKRILSTSALYLSPLIIVWTMQACK